ncbi:hypothetical protein [Thalassobacillus sp. C254]|uniref:hypothetical protein n=1 Tax=Thalassobacillus sp. C254 TaxID=1225341 RepID=UPI0006CFB31C|nr:hypothetical protein [Thalassobacillus sp. C254]
MSEDLILSITYKDILTQIVRCNTLYKDLHEKKPTIPELSEIVGFSEIESMEYGNAEQHIH